MKFIHTSDIHIDSPLTARLDRDKIKERRAELISTLPRLAEEAMRHRAQAILISGDLFDTGNVTKRAIRAFFDTVDGAPMIEFFVLPGNHDAEVFRSVDTGTHPNLHVFEYGECATYELDGVSVTGISPCREGMLDSLGLDEGKKNIVMLHGELRDRCSEEYESVGIKDAAGKNIDYIALGHYHSYSVHRIDERGVAVYSGTPEGRGFDECGECGYVLIDTDGESVTHRFIPFARRRMRIASLPLDGLEKAYDVMERAEEVLRNIPREDLVRLELCGSYTPGLWKDTSRISDAWRERFYHFEVKDSSHISVNADDYKFDKTLKGEFIRMVYDDATLDEEMKRRVVECGIFALMGEE